MSKRTLFILLLVSLSAIGTPTHAQSSRSVELCGVSFKLGMTRFEVTQKFVLQSMASTQREKFLSSLAGGDAIPIVAYLFGLPDDTSRCFGWLEIKQDRVVAIRKRVSAPVDAVSFARALYVQLREMVGPKGSLADIQTREVRNEDKGVQMVHQVIEFAFGGQAVQVDVSEASGDWGGLGVMPRTEATIYTVLRNLD